MAGVGGVRRANCRHGAFIAADMAGHSSLVAVAMFFEQAYQYMCIASSIHDGGGEGGLHTCNVTGAWKAMVNGGGSGLSRGRKNDRTTRLAWW